MGKSGAEKGKKLSMDDLPDLLGERLPDIKHNPIGRLRLMNALKNRFGNNWRTLPGMQEIMKDFDEHADFNIKLAEMKMIKGKSKGK